MSILGIFLAILLVMTMDRTLPAAWRGGVRLVNRIKEARRDA